ncbi:PAS domain S-box-containing protein [Rhizobium sp. BK650]|uniref:PAS domain S-box protein n=1 Tax=Rhizobium sp. BK650 TaxID=2586990 RepID=UPI00160FAB21|nr:PAS domain S-box protein [Rhizobium sp. BK650]MBB3660200.1 PAS domain S-box-containing protein [Rhizobium sp. BK650]
MADNDFKGEGGSAEDRLQQLEAGVRAAQPGHDAAAFLAAIVESSDDAIISKSLQGIITTWNKSAERVFGYTAEEAVGRPITMLIPQDRMDEEPTILARISAGERVDHFETIRRRKDGTLIDISLTISPIRDGNGRIIGASKIARDISDRRRAAQHQDLLLREMHHRVKNLFAITGSIITLAARTAQTPAELATGMKDRLVALSRAHEMTLPSFTGGEAFVEQSTTLFTLLSSLLSPFEDEGSRRWQLHGEDAQISADRVTSLALLFHEYATNAVKYGALSVPEGRLDVTLTSRPDSFEVAWRETNAAPGSETKDTEKGFGTTLEQMVVRTLNAQVSRDWHPDGLLIRLTVPRDAFASPS